MEDFNFSEESDYCNEGRQLSRVEKLVAHLIEIAPFENIIYKFLFSKTPGDRILRVRLSFFLGIIYGLIIYSLTAYRVKNLPPKLNQMTLISLPAIISLAMARVPSVRCFMLLVVFNFISSAGKALITGHIINTIIDGPVNNTIENARYSYQMINCNIELAKNLTDMSKQQRDMSSTFFKKVFSNNVHRKHSESIVEFEKFQNKSSKRNNSRRSLILETDVKNNGEKNNFKNIKICQEVLDLQEKKCKESQKTYQQNCLKNLDELNFFFWTFYSHKCEQQIELCDHESGMSKKCEELKADSDEIEQATKEYKEQTDELNPVGTNISAPVVENLKPIEPISLENLTELRADELYFTSKFNQYIETVTLLFELLHTLATFSSILVFINTYKYYASYTSDMKFDNFFISKLFREIDTRRLDSNKRTLLPLRSFEASFLVYPFDMYVSAYQKPIFKINLILHIGLLVFMILLLLVDFLIADFLKLLMKNSIKEYEYKGDSEMMYEVIGTGYVANLLRNATYEFHEKKNTVIHESTAKCEFTVGELKNGDYVWMGVSSVLLVFYMGLELYLKRLNKVICEFYFPKWEKQRTVWLYNDRLKKRLRFLETAKKKILRKQRSMELEKHNESALFAYLELYYENLVEYLNKFDVFKNSGVFTRVKKLAIYVNKRFINPKYCVLCGHKERVKSEFCSTCRFVYCMECWIDVDEKCVGCTEAQFDYDDFEE